MSKDHQYIRDLQVKRLDWPSLADTEKAIEAPSITPVFRFSVEEEEELGGLVRERQDQRSYETTSKSIPVFLKVIEEDIGVFLLNEIVREDELDALRPRMAATPKGELALTRDHFHRLRRKIVQLRHGLSVETIHSLDPAKKDDPELGNLGWSYLYHELTERGISPPKAALMEKFEGWLEFLDVLDAAFDAAHDRLPDQLEEPFTPAREARVLLVARILKKYEEGFDEYPPSSHEPEDDEEEDGEYDPDIPPESIVRGRRGAAPMTTFIRRVFEICYIEIKRAHLDYIREAKEVLGVPAHAKSGSIDKG